MPELMTVEDFIAAAIALPPRPAVGAVLGTLARQDAAVASTERMHLRAEIVARRLQYTYVDDLPCGASFTMLGLITHLADVSHEPGQVVPQDVEVDERGLGRGGESKTAAHR